MVGQPRSRRAGLPTARPGRPVPDRHRRHRTLTRPVANFHLGNGARLMRLCWAATGAPGLGQSLGIMANYLYEPQEVSDRARHYRGQGVVSVGDEVARLFEGSSE
ncbi:MAG: malonyl-CoA decarboxylase family protein [Candidatus Microthrix sp.]|nr:malonyl-CoA decarboxylase family protein [Candidatus Microthrix sp.]